MSSDLSYTGTAAFDLTLRYDTPSQKLQLVDNSTATAVAEQDLSQTGHVVVTGSAQADKLTIDFSSLSDSSINFNSLCSDFILFQDSSGSDTLKTTGKDVAWTFDSSDGGTAFGGGTAG